MSQVDIKREKEAEILVTVTATHHKKTPMVVGIITAGLLTTAHNIPRRNTRNKTGYQRELAPIRIHRLMKDLSQRRVDLPTAVLLNLRNYETNVHLIKRGEQHYFCPGSEALYVVDGQHRIVALANLVNEDPDRWESFEIPFVCMLGASEREEMEQFYIVNSTAKSVRTDLALDLLKQRAESDPQVMQSLLEKGESWKIDAQTLTEELAKTPLWENRIQFPGQPKSNTVIGSAGMVGSLRPLLNTPYFHSIKISNQVKILDSFWQGVREAIPEVFNNPSAYTLQKSTGVQVMHALLVIVIEYIRSKGWSLTEPVSYTDSVKKALLNLEGDTASGGLVRGADFWVSGSEGAAGSFSSNAGRRVLIAKIKGLLPEVEVE